MTDNEIIKALELIKSDPNCDMVYGRYISTMTLDDTLNLINRQKAEIENYSHNTKTMANDIRKLQKALEQATMEIERYKQALRNGAKYCSEKQAEAIKEFANWQEIKLANNPNISAVALQSIIVTNDNLLKELVGEDG